MSCAIWEERVALYAGGDLDAAEAAGVERHLSGCAACLALAEELCAGLDSLRAAHAGPIEAERYAAVRGRVLAELAKSPSRRRAVWPWAVPLVAAAAIAVLVMMMKPAVGPVPKSPRAVAVAPAVERGLDRSLTVAAPKRREAPRPLASAGRGPAPPEAADAPVRMVQLATADPNVVIYWLFEERGEER